MLSREVLLTVSSQLSVDKNVELIEFQRLKELSDTGAIEALAKELHRLRYLDNTGRLFRLYGTEAIVPRTCTKDEIGSRRKRSFRKRSCPVCRRRSEGVLE